MSTLKPFEDKKVSAFERQEKIVEERENAGYQHFPLFQHCFPKPFLSKLWIVW